MNPGPQPRDTVTTDPDPVPRTSPTDPVPATEVTDPLPPDPQPSDPDPLESPLTQSPPNSLALPRARSRTGTAARLPKSLRDQINSLLLEGVPYQKIIDTLGEPGKHLKRAHIHQWRIGGYQDWLKEQSWIDNTRARQETAVDLMGDFDATQVNHAALQLGTLHIFEAFRDLGPGSLDKRLGGDSGAFARLLNALSRSSRETLQLQKYRDACLRARAELQNLKDPKRPLTEDEHRAIVLKVDDILGLRMQESPPAQYSPELLAKAQELLDREAAARAHAPAETESPRTPPPEPQ